MSTVNALPPLDPLQRYTITEAVAYLRTSRASIYKHAAKSELRLIKEGRRTFVPGAEIIRLSAIPGDA